MAGPVKRIEIFRWTLLSVGAMVLPALALAQTESAGKPLTAKFHEDFRRGDPKSTALRPIREDNFVWENGGARVLIPAGQGKIPTTGVAANFKIKGDFEITASYEILKAEKPTEVKSYGVGVILYVAIDTETRHAVSLSRRLMPKGNTIFVAHIMKPGEDKPPNIKTRGSKETAGKLRVKRVGTMVSFHVAEGDGADFVPIYQDAKAKRVDAELGNGEIRYFQIGGDAGDSEAALDLRLLDLTVHAEELPGYEAAPAKSSGPAPPRTDSPRPPETPPSTNWTFIGGGIGLLVVLAAIGAGAFFVLRGRKKPAPAPKQPPSESKASADEKNPRGIMLTCACGKKLKLKAALAGKKIKCPDCQKSLSVPLP